MAEVLWRAVSALDQEICRHSTNAARRGERWFALALFATLAMGSGCAEPCDDLQTLCERCVDPSQQLSCEIIVDVASSDACESAFEELEKICD